MPNNDGWLQKLDYLKDELTDIRMVLDELLHVLRYIERNGLGVHDADAHWHVDGSGQSHASNGESSDVAHASVDPSAEDRSVRHHDSTRRRRRTRLFD